MPGTTLMQDTEAMTFASAFFHGQDRLRGLLPAELCAPSYRAEIVGFPAMDAAGHGAFGQARKVSAEAFVLLTIEDGRVTHLRAMFDRMGLMQQLGVVPA